MSQMPGKYLIRFVVDCWPLEVVICMSQMQETYQIFYVVYC